MNETTETQAALASDDLALRQLHHVGAAYGLIFLLLFAFAWRSTQATRRLSERVDELEREHRGDG
jgi:di/tricarboxylate transporter